MGRRLPQTWNGGIDSNLNGAILIGVIVRDVTQAHELTRSDNEESSRALNKRQRPKKQHPSGITSGILR